MGTGWAADLDRTLWHEMQAGKLFDELVRDGEPDPDRGRSMSAEMMVTQRDDDGVASEVIIAERFENAVIREERVAPYVLLSKIQRRGDAKVAVGHLMVMEENLPQFIAMLEYMRSD